jgi:hypothetical protein
MKIFTTIAVLATLCLLLTTRHCAAQLNTGSTNPGTATKVTLAGSSFTWNSPTGALVSGGSTASTAALLSFNSGTTDLLQLTNFGFAIPVGSTIDGITVHINRASSGLSLTILGLTLTGSVNDNIVRLIGPAGVPATNKASGAAWPSGMATANYGSSSDTWGASAWTPAMVNDPTFGVSISSQMNGGVLLGIDLIPGASIDAVTINITYSLPVTLALNLDQWNAAKQGPANQLNWQANSTDYDGEFIVERSNNGQIWTPLATVPASFGPKQYSYSDEEPPANGPAYYRLRLHSADQTDSWSTVQVLSARSTQPVIMMYPNPFYNTINISAPGAFTQLTLRNNQGATIWVKEYPGGINSTQIPMSGQPRGLYYLTIDGTTYKLMKGSK